MNTKAVMPITDEQIAEIEALYSEREAFEDATSTIDPSEVRRLDGFREGWEAYATWQRRILRALPEGELPWTGEQLARAWYLAEYGPGHDLAPGYAVAFARELAIMLAANDCK